MNSELILTIVSVVLGILTIVGILFSYYFYVKKKLSYAVAGQIDEAENKDECGAAKKAEVIAQLKKLIPAIFKPFISDAALDALVQAAFDKIEEYAKKQVEKKAKKEACDENA